MNKMAMIFDQDHPHFSPRFFQDKDDTIAPLPRSAKYSTFLDIFDISTV